MAATIKTQVIKDINEKELYYITVENNGKRQSINVGKGTYDRINEVLNDKTQKDEKKEESNTKSK